jgi:hypothetical protein
MLMQQLIKFISAASAATVASLMIAVSAAYADGGQDASAGVRVQGVPDETSAGTSFQQRRADHVRSGGGGR